MSEQDFDRTEKATPKKREEARKKGQVARSKDVPFAAIMIASFLLAFYFHAGSAGLRDMVRETFSQGFARDFTAVDASTMMMQGAMKFLIVIGPVFAVMLLAAGLSNVMMVGFHMSEEAMSPDVSRIDPIKGFQRIFSLQSLLEFLKSCLKVGVIFFVMYYTFKKIMPELPLLMEMDITGIGDQWWRLTVRLLGFAAGALTLLAAVDYLHQWWENERKLRMTKAELREEYKQTDGDPLVKSRQRALQREVARRRMMADVPKANVVITNPTHIAVAIMYEAGMGAPKVVAKGAGVVAEKIKEVAREAGVTIYEDKPLARFLFRKVKIGQEIPVNVYHAVAEVLAYIYRLGKKRYAGKEKRM